MAALPPGFQVRGISNGAGSFMMPPMPGGFSGMNKGQPVDPPNQAQITAYMNRYGANQGTTLNTAPKPVVPPAMQVTDMSKYMQAVPTSVPYAQNYYAPQMQGALGPQPGVGPGPGTQGSSQSLLTDFLAKLKALGIGGMSGAGGMPNGLG